MYRLPELSIEGTSPTPKLRAEVLAFLAPVVASRSCSTNTGVAESAVSVVVVAVLVMLVLIVVAVVVVVVVVRSR